MKTEKDNFGVHDFFDDPNEITIWANNNVGNTEYVCEFCGIYKASKPRCNKCEAQPKGTDHVTLLQTLRKIKS